MGLRQKVKFIGELRNQNVSWSIIFYFALSYLGTQKFFSCVSRMLAKLWLLKNVSNRRNLCFDDEFFQNKIVIIETGVLGDCALIIDVLKELSSYCLGRNIELTIVCSHAMSNVFCNYAKIEARYICFNNRNNITNKEFLHIRDAIGNDKFKYLLRRDRHPTSIKLSSMIIAQKSFYYGYDVPLNSIFEKEIHDYIFTNIKLITDDVFIPNIWREMLHDIGMKDYKTKLGKIFVSPLTNFSIPRNEYVLFCPEGSNRAKTIDVEKISSIIDYIEDRYSIGIIISSDCRNKNYQNELQKLISAHKLKSYLGNTTLDEFIHLVSNARLVISCDTGAVHIAAVASVPCICLSGYWDRAYFLPYQFDIHSDNDVFPIALYPKDLPNCAYCGAKSEFAKDEQCQKKLIKGLSAKCNSDINNEDVFIAIDNVLQIDR